jgi:ADP-ribose pyrophosphatase YjhB (NUDIX family)
MNKNITTLILIYDSEKVLLGMKKRGFGEGKWNGFGGKVKVGEGLRESARRELLEETSAKLKNKEVIKNRGCIFFHFLGKPEQGQEVIFFSIASAELIGEPRETEEMIPKWFSINAIPYDKMWVDDKYWLPALLVGKNLQGEFFFNEDGSKILDKKLETK